MNFSRYLPKNVADIHDKTAIRTISNFDIENIANLDIESEKILYSIMTLMDMRDYRIPYLFSNRNSQEYYEKTLSESVSYQLWGFFKGENNGEKGVNIMSFGEKPEGVNIGFKTSWEYNPNYNPVLDSSIIGQLQDLRRQGDKFFKGIDFLIFDMEESGEECDIQEKNGINVAFCKFLETNDKSLIKKQTSLIKSMNKKVDTIYVKYRYTDGELDEGDKKIIRSFMKAGADILVGEGLHEVIPMQYYKKGMIFYSLGDFLTENTLVNELTADSSGLILDIDVSEDEYIVRFLPIDIVKGFPKLKGLTENLKFFDEFMVDFDLKKKYYSTDPEEGILRIKR